MLAGWFTAEVGRQPWVVYGLLRTKDAVTPSLVTADVLFSLLAYIVVYAVIYSFGFHYIYRLLRDGPAVEDQVPRLPGRWRWPAPARGRRGNDRASRAVEPGAVLGRRNRGGDLVYVILDGFDLGVGILFGTTAMRRCGEQMMASISPFWDGNETWLVVIGASLFAAFPVVYAVFLPAFYLPVLLLLFGLIFRGVAFEFRYAAARGGLWDWGFFLGSAVAAFVQGAAVGAMIRGIPVVNDQYAGGPFEWLSAAAGAYAAIGLVLGYALLGAGWLVLKSEGELRDWAWRRIPWLAGAVLVVLGLAVVTAFIERTRDDREPVSRSPVGSGLSRCIGLSGHVRRLRQRAPRRDGWPFALTVVFFLAAFRHARGDVLALHDPLLDHRRRRRGPGSVALLPVLGRGHLRIASHRDLHLASSTGCSAASCAKDTDELRSVAGHRCVIVAARLLATEQDSRKKLHGYIGDD